MIKPVGLNDIPVNRRKVRSKQIKEDIQSFLDSKLDAAEVDISCYKNFQSAVSSYAVVTNRIGGVRVVQRSGKLYLVREGVKV